MKKTRLTVMVALLGILSVGIIVLSGTGLAQFKLPKDLKDLDKAKDLIDTGKKFADAAKPWTYPEERATGQVVSAQVSPQFGGVWKGSKNAEAWTKYVNQVGRGLVFYSPRPDIKYRFAILNSDEINAFAAPGGYIFVTRGILKMMNYEAMLAGVLAHEIGHVAKRHVENTVKTQKLSGVALDVGLTYAARDGKIDAAAVDMARQVGNAGVDILMKTGYSRQQEFEADKVGTQTIAKMGYSPNGVRHLLKKLEKMDGSNDSDLKRLFSTHPPPGKRKDKVKELVEKKGYDTSKPLLQERYQGMLSQYPIP